MNENIHQRLVQAEDLFLSALSATESSTALLTFDRTWSILQADIDSALASNMLVEETIVLAHTVASRITIVATGFHDMQVETEALTASLLEELHGVFARLDLNQDLPASPTRGMDVQPDCPSRAKQGAYLGMPTPPTTFRYPAYFKASCNWLLANLHNPYPSSAVREKLSRETLCSRRDIDGWFIDARKRMGWNALRKTHFANKRVDIVDAATRFFLKVDDERPLDSDLEVLFAQIQQHATSLYSEKFLESTLAVKLDVAVKDMTPAMKAQAKVEESRRRQLHKQARAASTVSSYPSPAHSPDRSPEPSPPLPLDEKPMPHSPPKLLSNRKRRSTSEISDWEAEDGPRKRLRLDNHSLEPNTFNTGLPSPTPSSHEVSEIIEERPLAPVLVGPVPAVPARATSSRKRRLSEADIQGLPKRPRNHPILHAVSDPAPSIENWFQNNFALSNTESDLDIQLFDYSTLLKDTMSEFLPAQAMEPSPNLPSASEPICDSSQSDGPEVFDFEGLLFWPSPVDAPDSVESERANELCALDLDVPSLVHDFAFSNTFDSTAVSTSEFYDSSSLSGLDWNLLQNSSHIDVAPTSQTLGLNPSIYPDHSFSFFGMLYPRTVDDTARQAEKAAKQQKLWEMKEATRLLEEELATSC